MNVYWVDKNIFLDMLEYNAWSAQLLKNKTSKKNRTLYLCRELMFSPKQKMKDFVAEVSNITDYDGSTVGNTIYKLHTDNILIKDDYSLLIGAIGNLVVELYPLELRSAG